MKIDQEFKSLIPPLAKEEFAQLEKNVISEGCRDALVLWEETIIDGHNRFEICTKHNIEFKTKQAGVASREEAVLWIIKNQLGRRNLQAIDRVPLIERQRGILEEQAKARMIATQNNKAAGAAPPLVAELGKHEVREELAKQAGVGRTTYVLLKEITEKGTPELVEAVRNKEISAKNAATIASLPKEEQNEVFIGKDRKEVIAKARAIRGENSGSKTGPTPAAATKKKPDLHIIANGIVYDGIRYGEMAISQLERIKKEDPARTETLNRVIKWCEKQLTSKKG